MNSQEEVNKKMVELGRKRVRRNHLKNRNRASNNKSVRTLFNKLFLSIIPAIEEYKGGAGTGKHKKFRYLLEPLNTNVIAAIAVRCLLDRISQKRTTISVSKKIGGALEEEALFTIARNTNREAFDNRLTDLIEKPDLSVPLSYALSKEVFKVIPELRVEPWTPEEKASIGLFLIQTIIEETGIVSINNLRILKNNKRTTESYVVANDETLTFLEEADAAEEDMNPVYLPMVETPNDYTTPTLGGYDSEIYTRWGMIKSEPTAAKRMTFEQMPKVYTAINAQQKVPLRVNEEVFEVFAELWNEGVSVAGLPMREDELIPEFTGDYSNEEYKNYRIDERNISLRNVATRGRRIQVAQIYNIAKMFLDKNFFIPYKMDFRGRLNAIPSFLTPQGNDVSKGLLEFANGKELTSDGLDWLCISGANHAGKDKVTYQERVDWVKENAEFIYNIYLDPIDNLDWTKADDPFVFLSWCLEYGKIQDKVYGEGRFVEWEDLVKAGGFISHFMCSIDATNSGLQIYSALLRDPIGAKATNLYDSGCVEDVYQEVANNTLERVKEISKTSTNENDKMFADAWLGFFDGKVPRSAVKRIVMTIPYSLTKFSAREYLEEWYNEELNERGMRRNRPFAQTFLGIRFLSEIIFEETMKTVVGASEIMEWLKEVATTLTENNCPIEYESPTGFIIHQAQRKDERIMVTTAIRKKFRVTKSTKRSFTLMQKGSELSKARQQNSVCPNFVHSIDASILSIAINYLLENGVSDFITVHDSFSTHASSVSILAGALRRAMVDVFEKNLLVDLKTQLENKFRIDLPDPPKQMDFNIKEILTSPYTFC